MKKTMMIIIFLILTFSFASLARAEEIVPVTGSIAGGEEIQIYTPCTGGNGICQMHRRGVGNVWVGANNVLFHTPCWQCINCNTVIITEGDPAFGYSIGTYAICPLNYVISPYGADLYLNYYSEVHYTSSSSLEGYHFFYQN